MNIICQIRRNKEYWLHSVINFDIFINNQHLDRFKAYIFLWDMSFRLKYIDFRKKIRDIAFTTIEDNNFDNVLLFNGDGTYKDSDLVIPVDEDDWFSSQLLNIIRAKTISYKRIFWNGYYKYNNDGKLYHVAEPKGTGSCNYGLIAPFKFNELQDHTKFKKEGSYYLPQKLSLKNTNPASLTSMMKWFTGSAQSCRNIVMNHISHSLNDNIIYPDEFSDKHLKYIELLRELRDSAIFDYSDMV